MAVAETAAEEAMIIIAACSLTDSDVRYDIVGKALCAGTHY